jgi:hypothetical protein
MGTPVFQPISAIVATMLVATGTACAADSASEESAPLIEYHRSGGIRGTSDRLTVERDGTATRSRGDTTSEITLAPRVMDRLHRILQQIDWSALQREYAGRGGGADMYEYTLDYGNYTVHAAEAALPEGLQPLVELLDGVLDGS